MTDDQAVPPPADAVKAAAEAITRCLMTGHHDFSTWMDNDDHLAQVALAAAAPALYAQERERIRERVLNRIRQLESAGLPYVLADKPAITELRILAEELGWTGHE